MECSIFLFLKGISSHLCALFSVFVHRLTCIYCEHQSHPDPSSFTSSPCFFPLHVLLPLTSSPYFFPLLLPLASSVSFAIRLYSVSCAIRFSPYHAFESRASSKRKEILFLVDVNPRLAAH